MKPERNPTTIIYAVGDVHGEAKRLKLLHHLIFERHATMFKNQPMQIVHLGDYVDRGENSAEVIDLLIALDNRSGVNNICLRGNHEAMMLDGLTNTTSTSYSYWLENGGEQTMESYRMRGHLSVPQDHITWLTGLPSLHVEHERKLIFVHAGIDPRDYPGDRDEIYLWTRSPRFFDVASWRNSELDGWTVVHGHTPTKDFFPDDQAAAARRINIDTGAVFGGRLTAAIFAPGEKVGFIYA